jgi:hypothetical protein
MTASHRPPDFDRHALRLHPLASRENKVFIERDHVSPDAPLPALPAAATELIDELAARLRAAKSTGASRMLTFGAHTIKNGLSPVLIRLIEQGWLTHLATNGAGIIHDWEFAFTGASSEDVRANVAEGRFGAWEETGKFINLALDLGAYQGLGYGASIGKFVHDEALEIPAQAALAEEVARELKARPAQAAAAADLLAVLRENGVASGRMAVPHPFKRFGLQSAAYRLSVPFTGHPMFGHDIIYEHPMSCGAAIGRTAERDFLAFASAVSNLEGGVYLSVGSAVMSPMVFEKTLSMARNLALQKGRRLDQFLIAVVDLAPASWDWRKGEPPASHPDYYLRFNKTFARMGGEVRYLAADNRAILPALLARLNRA